LSNVHVIGITYLFIFLCFIVLVFVAFNFFIVRMSFVRLKYRIFWNTLITFIVILGVVQYGPFIGKTIGIEYPLSLPRALISIETGDARLVTLTSDATRMVGRRGPTERELTAFLEKNGWKYKDKLGDKIIYENDKDTLIVLSHFHRGYWWYDLDSTPYTTGVH
jgi:hypothetical protein